MVSSQGVNEWGYHGLVHEISSQGVNMEKVNTKLTTRDQWRVVKRSSGAVAATKNQESRVRKVGVKVCDVIYRFGVFFSQHSKNEL